MAKRSDTIDKSERVKVSEEKLPTIKAPETVRLVLLRNLKLNYTGPVTDKLYVFERGGTELDVDRRDAEIMLAKRGGKCCPGGSGAQPYFAKV